MQQSNHWTIVLNIVIFGYNIRLKDISSITRFLGNGLKWQHLYLKQKKYNIKPPESQLLSKYPTNIINQS